MSLNFLLVEPTGRCGLRCPLCPTGQGRTDRSDRFLDPAVLDELLRSAAPATPRVGLWGWGEPTEHPDLPELVRVAHAHGCVVEVQSNGHGSREAYDALIDANLDQLTIALDGLEYDQVRLLRGRTVDPSRVRDLLVHLSTRRGSTDIVVQCIVTRSNEALLDSIAADACALGHRIEFKTLNVTGASPTLAERLLPGRPELRRPGNRPAACPFLAGGGALLADGTVVPCCYDWSGRRPLGRASDGWPALARVRGTVQPAREELCRGCAMSGLHLEREVACPA